MPRILSDEFIAEVQEQVNRPFSLYILKPDPDDIATWAHFTDYSQNVTYLGNTYYGIGQVVNRDDLTSDPKTVLNCNITFANVDKVAGRLVTENIDKFTSKTEIICYTVLLDDDGNVIAATEDDFNVSGCTINSEVVTFSCTSPGAFEDNVPRLPYYKNLCRFYFQDGDCQYLGAESACSRSYETCRQPNRFGGFPLIKDLRNAGSF